MLRSFVILLLFASVTSLSQTYYVDGINGQNSNNGLSLLTPWKTIQKACNSATPGSTVLIRGGIYYETINVGVSGLENQEILFTSFPGESAIIDGADANDTALLRISDHGYLIFADLEFRNLYTNNAKGISIESVAQPVDRIVLKHVSVHHIGWTSNTTALPVYGNNALGIVARGYNSLTNLTIDGCEIYNNTLGYSEAVSLNGNINVFTISNSIIHDNSNIGIDVAGNYGVCANPANDHARNGTIRGNTCYRNISPGAIAAGIYVDGGQSVIIERNQSYENGWGIEVGCEQNGETHGIIVKNNIIFNNRNSGLSVGGYNVSTTGVVTGSVFRNNTFFQNNSLANGMGEISLTKAINCVFENNLFYTSSQNVLLNAANISPQDDIYLNYNCWYTPVNNPNNIVVHWKTLTFTTFSEYKAWTQQESHSTFINPSLNNPALPAPDVCPQNVSYCINHGDPATSVPPDETDFVGNPRIINSVIDMGAEEALNSLGTTISDKPTASVWPNPFRQSVTIRCENDCTDSEISLYDIAGKVIRKNKMTSNEISINHDGIQSGMYLYKIARGSDVLASGRLIAE